MNYLNISNLNEDIKRWISELPEDLDLIVGIPRSGLLVANILALHLNLPFTDFEGLLEGRVYETGKRFSNSLDLSKTKKILVVDDSLFYGQQMEQVREKIKAANLPHKIYYGTLYVTPKGYRKVDFWHKIIDVPRIFEWNVLHHSILKKSCVDIDGVLCRDPTQEENDDGEKYRHFIRNAKLLIRPSVEMGWLVTCRLEKYRKLTEEWLSKHNIKYRNLVMMNLPDKKSRVALGNHASFKAGVYQSSGTSLFIESSYNQAQEIVRMTGKSVLCTENWQMINPKILQKIYNRRKEYLNKLKEKPFMSIYSLMQIIKRKTKNLKWKILASKSKKH